MPELPSYARRIRAKAHSETARFIQHKLLTGACVAISVIIVRLALWHFHRLTLTWAEVWINLLLIAGSYAIVIAGAFVVNLFRAPGLLDRERAHEIAAFSDRLKQKTEESTALAESVSNQKETSITFANLVNEGKNIEERIVANQKPHELTAVTQQLNDWIKRTEAALIGANLHADASIFVHSGERLSAVQTQNAVPDFLHSQSWKHYDLARLSFYLKKLQEIVERRNL